MEVLKLVSSKLLLELNILKKEQLVAGKDYIDKEITWVYAKHTKEITSWVQSGEFLLVSGFEYGIDEKELVHIIKEAALNNLSGILIEGGINFEKLSKSVIDCAEDSKIPLFFIKGTISFLDLSQKIIDLIYQKKYKLNEENALVECLFNSNNCSQDQIEKALLLLNLQSTSKCCIVTIVPRYRNVDEFKNNVRDLKGKDVFKIKEIKRELDFYFKDIISNYQIDEISRINYSMIDYLLCSEDEASLESCIQLFKETILFLNNSPKFSEINIIGAFSEVVESCSNISEGINENYYTLNLIKKNIIESNFVGFKDIGSYQLFYEIKDKNRLKKFRDKYLLNLYVYDKKNSTDLLDVLKEYLLQGGNISQTSKLLYLHRSTLYYQIEKIKSILGMDIDDIPTRLNLLNAYTILKLFPFH